MRNALSQPTHRLGLTILFVFLQLLIFPSRGGAQSPPFNVPVVLNAGNLPYGSTSGDFNMDGHPDIAVSNYYGVSVSVFLGNGAGSFTAAGTYPLSGSRAGLIASGYVNADGFPDLVVAQYMGSNVFCLLGNGNGTFQNPIASNCGGTAPISVVLADFNNDSLLDVATSNYSSGNISILSGLGNGQFSVASTWPSGSNPYNLVKGDLNQDGIQDLVASHAGSPFIKVFYLNPAGSVASMNTFNTTSGCAGLSVGDLDNDGFNEVVVNSTGAAQILIFRGIPGGLAVPATVRSKPNIGYDGLQIADYNRDGWKDIIADNTTSGNLSYFQNTGDFFSGFISAFPSQSVITGSPCEFFSQADLNHDGSLDLIVPSYSGSVVNVFLNGTPPPTPTYTVNSSAGPNGTVSPSGNTVVNQGDSLTVTLTPAPGYQVASLTVNGTPVSPATTYTFTNIQSNQTLSATFSASSGTALHFDGVDDHVTVPRTLMYSGVTYSAWIRTVATDSFRIYAGNPALTIVGDHENAIILSFGIHGGRVNYNNYLGGWHNYYGNSHVNDGNWHHVAATHDPSSQDIRIYVDGILDGSAVYPYGTGSGSPAFDRIGGSYLNASGTGALFKGDIDEVRVYNRALTASEICNIAAQNLPGIPTNGLVGHFPMNEGSGNVTLDANNPAIAGVLQNGPAWVPGNYNPIPGNCGSGPNAPVISFNPASLNIGLVGTGFSYGDTVYVKNTGNAPLIISNLVSGLPVFTVSHTYDTIPPGDSALFVVTFSPVSGGAVSTQLTFTHNAAGGTSVYPVSAAGSPSGFTFTPRNLGFPGNFFGASFFNGRVGCISGANGTLYATHDGGVTWSLLPVGTNETITSIQLIGSYGWIFGTNGLICVSYNGGASWVPFNTGTNATFYAGSFVNGNIGFAVGSNGTICRYNGTSWVPFNTGVSNHFYGVSAILGTAYAVGSGGIICRYVNGSWVPQVCGCSHDLYGVAFWDDAFGYAGGANGTLVRTTDGGTTWVTLVSGIRSAIRNIKVFSRLIAWAVCDDGTVLQTLDGGNTWVKLNLGIPGLTSVDFNECQGVAVGRNGLVVSFASSFCNPGYNPYYIRRYLGTRYCQRGVTFLRGGIGYSAGRGGNVYRTLDGGVTWNSTGFRGVLDLQAVRAVGNTVFLAGHNGHLCKSTNGGINWTVFNTGVTNIFYGLSFWNEYDGWAVGSGGIICRYNGTGWVPYSSGWGGDFRGVYAIRRGSGGGGYGGCGGCLAFACGTGGMIMKFDGGGWVPMNTGTLSDLYAIRFVNDNVGYACGAGGYVCKTIDGGNTWTRCSPHCSHNFLSIEIGCRNEVIVAGDSGAVFMTVDGGNTWTDVSLGRPVAISGLSLVDGAGMAVAEEGEIYGFTFNSVPANASILPDSVVQLCAGGSVLLQASGGVEFRWNTGDTSATLQVTAPGNYWVEAANSNGCVDTARALVGDVMPPTAACQNITISLPPSGSTTITPGQINNGSADMCGIQGFSVNPNSFNCSNKGVNPVTLTVTDVNGNTSACSATVTVTTTPLAAVATSPIRACGYHVSCQSAADGSISLNVSGGCQPYRYLWSGPGGYSSVNANISGLASGTYSVTVTDANGDQTTTGITLTKPAQLVVTACNDQSVALGYPANEFAILAVTQTTGGCAPYTYSWSNGAGNGASVIVRPAFTTTYTVTVTDANGCTATDQIVVTTVDVRCQGSGSKMDHVIMCGGTGSHGSRTKCVKVKDVYKKLQQGYTLGPCGSNYTFNPNGGDCGATDYLSCQCNGKITRACFTYSGPSGATVVVSADGSGNRVLGTFTNVQSGQVLCVNGNSLTGRGLNSRTYIRVNGGAAVKFYTNCSKAVRGEVQGPLTLSSWTDESGSLCTNAAPPVCACSGKITRLKLTYSGPMGATVKVYGNSNHSSLIGTFAGLNTFDPILLSNMSGLPAKVYLEIVGSRQPDVVITVSCSKLSVGDRYYYYDVAAWKDQNGNSCPAGTLKTEAENESEGGTDETILGAYPNPFAESTTVEFYTDKTEDVVLKVYSLQGTEVATLFEGQAQSGSKYKLTFNPGNVGSGVYIAKLVTASGVVKVEKLVLQR